MIEDVEARRRAFGGLTAYQRWQREQGVPVVGGYWVEDVNAISLTPWPQMGVLGAFLNLEGAADTADARLYELPPHSALKAHQHIYEELDYVLQGRGRSTVGQDPDKSGQQGFDWGPGSLFSPPLNTWHEIANPYDEPARLLVVTNAPLIMNLFADLNLVFHCPFSFRDRYAGEEHYFAPQGALQGERQWESNLIPDVRSFQLIERPRRGAGGSTVWFQMAENAMVAHSSEMPVGAYKKAHFHGPAAHILILKGKGYSLLWCGDPWWSRGEAQVRVDWKPGALFVPPDRWFHQHFNTGPEPARYLALRWGSLKHSMGEFFRQEGTETSVKLGGNQVEYEDEDPEIRRLYQEELRKAGIEMRMPPPSR